MMTILAFLGALGILVTLHEMGHFLVARWCGVRVIRFSVGFGRPLFTWQRSPQHTEWALCWIPLGGYVRMADERDEPSLSLPGVHPGNVFNRKPVLQRMAIVVAGPLMNLLVACVFYGVLQMQERTEAIASVAQPLEATLAARAGFEGGDRIISMNGNEVARWSDVNWETLRALMFNESLVLLVERSGAVLRLGISADDPDWPSFTPSAAAALGLHPREHAVNIGQVVSGSAGEAAGLQAGDRLLRIDDIVISSTFQFTDQIRQSAGRERLLTIERQGQVMSVYATPQAVTGPDGTGPVQGRLGIRLRGDLELDTVRLGVGAALWAGVRQTVDMSAFSVMAFYRMLTGGMSWRMLGGPVTIADAAGQSAQVGLAAYVGFLAMLSVSLGVLNLLPVPVLDGGHLMYYLVELLTGRPVSDQILEWGQKLGLLLIGLLTALALFNDFSRFF